MTKKLVCLAVILFLTQCSYAQALFDNFDSYPLVDIFGDPVPNRSAKEATGGLWDGNSWSGMVWNDSLTGALADLTYVQISVDPCVSSKNQTLRVCTYKDDHKDPCDWRPKCAVATLPTALQIGPTDKKTVFFRVYRETNRMGLGYVGLAEDSYQPHGNNANQYFPWADGDPNYCANFCVPLRVWSHTSSYPEITVSYGSDSKNWVVTSPDRPADPCVRLPQNTWFNVWMVIDNAAAKVDIYVKIASGSADVNDLLVANADFLNPVTEANGLTKFALAVPFSSTSGELKPWIYVDDIYVFDGNMFANPKEAIAPHNPTPANGATNQPLSVTFKWNTALEIDPDGATRTEPNVTGHFIYYTVNSTNYGPFFVDEVNGSPEPNATYGPVSFAYDDVVNWHIEEQIDGDSNGSPKNIVGPVWSFAVFRNVPTIVGGPWDIAANVGDSVVFTIDACDPAGANTVQYRWYKGNSGDTGNPVTVQSNEPNCPIGPIADSNFGSYWCRVTSRAALDSSAAKLIKKALLAKWPLDAIAAPNDVNDVTGNGYNGTILGTGNDITVVSGKVGNAFDFNEPAKYVVIGKTMARPNLFTVTAWIKNRDVNTGDSTIFAWREPSGSSSNRAYLYVESTAGGTITPYPKGVVRFGQYIPTAADTSQGPNGSIPVDDNEWHFVAVTFDNGLATLYVDGVSDTNSSIVNYNNWTPDANMCIGTNLIAEANNRFDGAIDDVRLYNYPLSKVEMANIYLETEPYVCTASKAADLNGDCKVNFSDFAIFAENWLITVDYPDLAVLSQEWLACMRYGDGSCPGLVLP